MKDRKEKAKEINPTSVGRNLNFGANMVKFEPPPEQKGGRRVPHMTDAHMVETLSKRRHVARASEAHLVPQSHLPPCLMNN